MDIHKSASWHGVGTFYLTAIMLVFMVFQALAPTKASGSVSQNESDNSQRSSDVKGNPAANEESVVIRWIMPSVIALAMIISAGLQVLAARARNKPVSENAPENGVPSSEHEEAMAQKGQKISELTAELAQSKEETNHLARTLDQRNKEALARAELDRNRASIRTCRTIARRIKEAWPDSDFIKNPFHILSWQPAVGNPQPWFERAAEWRDRALSVRHVALRSKLVDAMDFDEAMECLEQAELALPDALPPVEPSIEHYPSVVITEWGQVGNQPAFSIRNIGQNAYDVCVDPPLRIGEWVLRSDEIGLLTSRHEQVHLRCWMENPPHPGMVPLDMPQRIWDSMEVNANGFRILPRLRITYKDGHGGWMSTTYQLIINRDNNTIIFDFLKRESIEFANLR